MPKVKDKKNLKKELSKELYEKLVPILANLKLVLDEKQFQQNVKNAVKTLVRGAVWPKEAKQQKAIKSTQDKKETKVTIDKAQPKITIAKTKIKSAKAAKVADVGPLPVVNPKSKTNIANPTPKAKEVKIESKKK